MQGRKQKVDARGGNRDMAAPVGTLVQIVILISRGYRDHTGIRSWE